MEVYKQTILFKNNSLNFQFYGQIDFSYKPNY